ncbi:hypothetical protein ES288_A11G263900v1 [Gossypium darwinii]|uniref:Uncharacterized protein n=1 Tax=Gossypium darwinii TaxID=34276 RepID=A0A5D2ENZ8_GOSDA|nr:hypothetical protein ES288_A11G263900v1 [Gossypium darwinii]
MCRSLNGRVGKVTIQTSMGRSSRDYLQDATSTFNGLLRHNRRNKVDNCLSRIGLNSSDDVFLFRLSSFASYAYVELANGRAWIRLT